MTTPLRDLWYPITALRRPLTEVRLKGAGYVCRGHRGPGARPAYFGTSGGARVRLRPAPVLFQPLGDWPDTLPAPAPIETPERSASPARRAPEAPPIPYSTPGHIGRAEAEERLIRALRTCRTYRACDFDVSGSRILWPAVLREWSDYTGHVDDDGRFIARDRTATGATVEQPLPQPRFAPTPRDHSDVLTAMAWFSRLAPVEHRYRHKTWRLSGDQLLVSRRALDPPWSWRQIGEEAGRSHEWARARYETILDRIEGIANAIDGA